MAFRSFAHWTSSESRPRAERVTINARGEAGVAELPAGLARLTSLRTLRIRARRLTTLPDAIVELPAGSAGSRSG